MTIRVNGEDNTHNRKLKDVYIALGFYIPVQCTELEEAVDVASAWIEKNLDNKALEGIEIDDVDAGQPYEFFLNCVGCVKDQNIDIKALLGGSE